MMKKFVGKQMISEKAGMKMLTKNCGNNLTRLIKRAAVQQLNYTFDITHYTIKSHN